MCSTPAWRGKDALLHSAPGAGQQVFLTLLVYLLKLGTLDGKQIAALIGVARDRWSRQSPRCALHRSVGGQSPQPYPSGILPAVAGGW